MYPCPERLQCAAAHSPPLVALFLTSSSGISFPMLALLSWSRGEFETFWLATAETSSTQWGIILAGVRRHRQSAGPCPSSRALLTLAAACHPRCRRRRLTHAPPLFSSRCWQCVTGTLIGWAGWYCRDLVSATSYTLIGVANKMLTVRRLSSHYYSHAALTPGCDAGASWHLLVTRSRSLARPAAAAGALRGVFPRQARLGRRHRRPGGVHHRLHAVPAGASQEDGRRRQGHRQ